jgi:hypothetical protein
MVSVWLGTDTIIYDDIIREDDCPSGLQQLPNAECLLLFADFNQH